MNRALRAATLGVLLLSPVALTACSSGQVTQTETQERDKTGPMAEVGGIVLRQVQLAYPTGGGYEPGDDAELQMVIVNNGDDDALVDVSGDGFSRVRVTGGGTAAGAGGTATTSPSDGSSGSAGRSEVDVPADSILHLGEEGPTVTLVNLSDALTPGQTIDLTLSFENAGDVSVKAQVATPDRDLPRGEGFDFHEEEEQSGNEGATGVDTGSEG